MKGNKPKFDPQSVEWENVLPLYIDATYRTEKGWGPCPYCGGANTFRIFYENRKGKAGWFCSKCDTGGNFVGLINQVTGKPFREIFYELETKNYNNGMPIVVSQPKAAAKKRPEKSPEELRRELQQAWDEARPVTEDSPVWKYLAHRIPGLKLEWIGPDVRCHPGMKYWHDEKMQGRYPVMLQRLVSSTRVARTLQRCFLTRDGAKVPFYDAKGRSAAKKQMSSPDGPAGGSIRLNNARSRNLALTEGTETGYSVVAKYENRIEVRGMLDCGNLSRADIDWSLYDRIDIYADRDEFVERLGYRPGEHHAEILAEKLRTMGKAVRIIRPVEDGMDFCDIWIKQYARMKARKEKRAERDQAREAARAQVRASMAIAA
jgi:putative DNA primase/helicase